MEKSASFVLLILNTFQLQQNGLAAFIDNTKPPPMPFHLLKLAVIEKNPKTVHIQVDHILDDPQLIIILCKYLPVEDIGHAISALKLHIPSKLQNGPSLSGQFHSEPHSVSL